MKKTVYLDTTIPSYYFDKRETLREYIEITKQWWLKERDSYYVFVSEETLAELEGGNYPKKKQIIAFAASIEVLPQTEDIIEIAQIYINQYLMPQVLKGDALHLAYASYYKIDFLMTWNCNHLANANKREHIRKINTKLKLFIPEIVTPMELFREEDL